MSTFFLAVIATALVVLATPVAFFLIAVVKEIREDRRRVEKNEELEQNEESVAVRHSVRDELYAFRRQLQTRATQRVIWHAVIVALGFLAFVAAVSSTDWLGQILGPVFLLLFIGALLFLWRWESRRKRTKIQPGDELDRGIDEYAAILGEPEFGERLKRFLQEEGALTTPKDILRELEETEEQFSPEYLNDLAKRYEN